MKGIEGQLQKEWDLQLQNKLHQIKPTLGKWETASRKNRREEIILARLRIGHSKLTHNHLFLKQPSPKCNECNTKLTTSHIFNCTKYRREKQKSIGDLQEAKEILGDSEDGVQKIFIFLNKIKIYSLIYVDNSRYRICSFMLIML